MYKKYLVTDGMSNDIILFMTDAPTEKVVELINSVKNAIYNGDSTVELCDNFKAEWLFKVLVDSEMEMNAREKAACIGWDIEFDMSEEE